MGELSTRRSRCYIEIQRRAARRVLSGPTFRAVNLNSAESTFRFYVSGAILVGESRPVRRVRAGERYITRDAPKLPDTPLMNLYEAGFNFSSFLMKMGVYTCARVEMDHHFSGISSETFSTLCYFETKL